MTVLKFELEKYIRTGVNGKVMMFMQDEIIGTTMSANRTA
jgi:hypothetical protein